MGDSRSATKPLIRRSEGNCPWLITPKNKRNWSELSTPRRKPTERVQQELGWDPIRDASIDQINVDPGWVDLVRQTPVAKEQKRLPWSMNRGTPHGDET